MSRPAPARFTFRIELQRGRLGHGKIELLEHIARTGSLASAARAMNMSYRRAWELLTLMNEMFGEAVAVTHPGRNTTGATEVTAFGRWLITTYRRLERRLAKAASATIDRLETPARQSPRRRSAIRKASGAGSARSPRTARS